MNKRPHPGQHGNGQHKKHKHGHSENRPRDHRDQRREHHDLGSTHSPAHDKSSTSQLPPPTGKPADVHSYVPFKTPKGLPPLPEIPEDRPDLRRAPFLHKSATGHGHDRNTAVGDLTYERLEFLGDAYLELFASRLIFHHFPNLPAGQQSQIRELLVKNETLSKFSREYGFENQVSVADRDNMLREAKDRGNKGLNKILGDVFEAYIAAIVLSDPEHGFARAEKWLTALWTPYLLRAAEDFHHTAPALQIDGTADPLKTYSPTAKADLQQRIMGPDVKLLYEASKPSVELKGDKLGQNRHWIAVYITGYGCEKKFLGEGEGANKAEAGNWAAIRAMHGESKELVDEWAEKLRVSREKRKKEREEKEKEAKGNKV